MGRNEGLSGGVLSPLAPFPVAAPVPAVTPKASHLASCPWKGLNERKHLYILMPPPAYWEGAESKAAAGTE